MEFLKKTNKWSKKERGITLVALVVTVVVLLILAGISLALVLGQNGIVKKASKSKDETNQAKADEIVQMLIGEYYADKKIEGNNKSLKEYVEDKKIMGQYTDIEEVTENTTTGVTILTIGEYKIAVNKNLETARLVKNPTTIAEAKINGVLLSETKKTILKDDEKKDVTIPAGFKIAEDSATDEKNGVVVEDKNGNQYVWIPCTIDGANGTLKYSRKDFGKYKMAPYSLFSEGLPDDEKTSIMQNNGYYIGRYETGEEVATANKKIRGDYTGTAKATIKKRQSPYNWIQYESVASECTAFGKTQGYVEGTITKMCSTYAWDTAISFIEETNPGYATSSPQGNYKNTSVTYIDLAGNKKQTSANNIEIIPTGVTVPVCNIYDMGGNVEEWTSGYCDIGWPKVVRGGHLYDEYEKAPAGVYNCNGTTPSWTSDIGFRITLFVKDK